MFVADCLQVNKQGHLCMEELDVLELAAKYGTPLYVMSETQIRKNCRMYQDSLKRFYGGNGLALYASKAFCCKEICRCRAVLSESIGSKWAKCHSSLQSWVCFTSTP